MSDESLRPIIIKKKKAGHGGHHGGAWKIAYADFVTAMMAFFLLMWLLGSTTKAERRGIAEYFQTPLKVALFGGEGSGDSTSIVKGGGEDLSANEGQVNRSEDETNPHKAVGDPTPGIPPKPLIDQRTAAEAELDQKEKALLDDLKARLERLIEMNPMLRPYKEQILLDITSEGLRVQIVDEQNRPMFATGSAHMQTYTRDILREIGKVLNGVPNRVGLSGHTDARPYAGGERGYSNWELSADRANSSRRELIAGGMEDQKILRVVGLGSAAPFDKTDLHSAMNRRISIIVMKRKAEEAVRSEGALQAEVHKAAEMTPQALGADAPDRPAASPASPAPGRSPRVAEAREGLERPPAPTPPARPTALPPPVTLPKPAR